MGLMRVVRCPRTDCRGPLLSTPADQAIDLAALERAVLDHEAAHRTGPCPDDLSALTLETQ